MLPIPKHTNACFLVSYVMKKRAFSVTIITWLKLIVFRVYWLCWDCETGWRKQKV